MKEHTLEHDDLPIGRMLSRREVLAFFGAAGASVLIGCSPTPQASTAQPTVAAPTAGAAPAIPTLVPTTVLEPTQAPTQLAATVPPPTSEPAVITVPACIIRPEATEGPFYVDEGLMRADIRSDPGTGSVREGTLLTLTFNVSQVSTSGCVPLPNAIVDIWHCDAAGVYSDVNDRGSSTVGQKWLRGALATDANGQATFTTIYPGWYPGRAVHIHFKVRPTQSSVITSQIFFDDSVSDQVFAQPPYPQRGTRGTTNSNDGIYRDELLIAVTRTDQGYAGTFDIGVQI